MAVTDYPSSVAPDAEVQSSAVEPWAATLSLHRHKLIVFLLALALVRGLIYAAIIPPWQAPDENGHFEYAWLVAHLGRRPTPQDVSPVFERELIDSLYKWRFGQRDGTPLPEPKPSRLNDLSEAYGVVRSRVAVLGGEGRFSLAYLWAALFIWPFRDQDLVVQLYAVRLASVIIGMGIVWLAWRIFRELMPQRQWLVVSMTAFVVFLPQHTFINAIVGDGPLAELAACVVFYGWLRLFRGGARPGNVSAVVGGTLVGMWAKNTAAFLLPLDVLALAFLLLTRSRDVIRRKWWLYLGLGLASLALLGWIILQTTVGQTVLDRLQGWWSAPGVYSFSEQQRPLDRVLIETYQSFWGLFGWMNVYAKNGWYTAVYILTGLAIVGLILPLGRRWSVPLYAKLLLGTAFLLALGIWVAAVLFTFSGSGLSQGRYLFPVTVPFAFFIVGGWARWIPKGWQPYFAPAVVLLLATLDAFAISAIWSYYYIGFYG
jgi:hypothetical protein